MKPILRWLLCIGMVPPLWTPALAQESNDKELLPGDQLLASYFEAETAKLEADCLARIESKEDWLEKRDGYRKQLLEMLALDPFPERTPLNAKITGKVEVTGEGNEFSVENVVFESMPGFYVTGNLYLPADTSKPSPTILYVCGHGPKKIDGVSYGNKVSYQHHGAWFARHGYVCLTIDTVQMGEIEGIHHGTYRYGMWWWNARGYSSAGAEAWNCIRALDYLESRPEVDKERFGVTGRSGGGAYSWWISAIDERINVAVPVAGITSLRNHVVDGCVEGHCDCMYQVNTYRWDYPMIAALVAPRPLLISNTDKDSIFPLDGVYQVHRKARRIYELLGAGKNLGLQITEGPHKDTQELRVHAFSWFERFLKGNDPPPLIRKPAEPFLTPKQLKVLTEIPADERTSTIHETFARQAPLPDVPESEIQWKVMAIGWMRALEQKVFRGWPAEHRDLDLRFRYETLLGEDRFQVFEFESQSGVRLPLFVMKPLRPVESVIVTVLDEQAWRQFVARMRVASDVHIREFVPKGQELPEPDPEGYAKICAEMKDKKVAHVFIAPRGIGPTAWSGDDRKQVQIRRRFMLLGQTLDSMRVWDIKRGLEASIPLIAENPDRFVHARDHMAANALYATLFATKGRWNLVLENLPASHRDGPDYLNVLRFLDIPAALAMATNRGIVVVKNEDGAVADYATKVKDKLQWK